VNWERAMRRANELAARTGTRHWVFGFVINGTWRYGVVQMFGQVPK
jgi:hypothetical protein